MPRQTNRKNQIGHHADVTIEELLDLREWDKIQDSFSAVTDCYIRAANPDGKIISASSIQPRLCREVLKESPAKESICGPCMPTFLHGKAVVDKNLSFSCGAGLHSFITPIAIGQDKILGYLIIGPMILVMRRPKEDYRTIAEELGLELDEFWSAFLEIKTISFHSAQSMVELIKNVIEYTLKLSYQNIIKERPILAAPSPEKMSKLMDALLDVAFEISRADIGSVMSLDKSRNELTITAYRGIPKDIANTARVRMGEGVSGIAAQEGRPFLIDKAAPNNRLAPYLKRPQIGSSMVIPLKVEEEVVGIMNVGALAGSPVKFDEEILTQMSKLASLASVAISPA